MLILWPLVLKFEVLGDHADEVLGVGEKVKIDVSCKQEHCLQGLQGGRNHDIPKRKSSGDKIAPWVSAVLAFYEFSVPNGIPGGSAREAAGNKWKTN